MMPPASGNVVLGSEWFAQEDFGRAAHAATACLEQGHPSGEIKE